ncbi:MAG: phosphoadenosine phosphosulfate reductase domain-containing protein [Candidatus Nasuia deltocephalinicola]
MKKIFSDFNPFFLKILNLNYTLEFINKNFNKVFFSNSLSFEDIFLINFINLKKMSFQNIFFLNTGRIFLNSFNFVNKCNLKYNNLHLNIYFSEFLLIFNYIKKYSLNAFYNNIILRKICCYIRKIELYNKIIVDGDVILTGQRKNRLDKNYKVEFDYNRNILKYNLLFNWDYKDIFYFFERFNVLVNFLYNYSYTSIGCKSCTKKVFSNNHLRYGRWWWETNLKKECGLHL